MKKQTSLLEPSMLETFLLIGYGKSGQLSAKILQEKGYHILVYDQKSLSQCPYEQISLEKFSTLPKDTVALLSPGIPDHHMAIKTLKKLGIPLTTELEILYQYRPHLTYIGITGTIGKSTLTALVFKMLQNAGYKAAIGGNFDKPALTLLPLDIDIAVLEISSYMAHRLSSIQFTMTVLINIFPNHLDWHQSLNHYQQAKINLLSHTLPNGSIFLGLDFKEALDIKKRLPKHIQSLMTVSGIHKNAHLYVDEHNIYHQKNTQPIPYTAPSLTQSYLYPIIGILYGMGHMLHVSNTVIAKTLKDFQGLPHRQEKIHIDSKRIAINASKTTNFTMVKNCLMTYNNIYWIAGGMKTKQDMPILLQPHILSKINHAYFIGESARNLYETFHKIIPCHLSKTLDVAVTQALQDSKNFILTSPPMHGNDPANNLDKGLFQDSQKCVILLAPGYASWDQFQNFEERGNKFKQFIHAGFS